MAQEIINLSDVKKIVWFAARFKGRVFSSSRQRNCWPNRAIRRW